MLTDAEIDEWEERLPTLMEQALRDAYLRTLAAGLILLICEGDHLVEVFPDGTKRQIKLLAPRLSVLKGMVLDLSPPKPES